MPVRANGIEMSMLELIESLDIIAGAHGVGRLDDRGRRTRPASARSSGWQTKRRPPWSCTGARELERLVVPPELERLKLGLAAAYADLVHDGRWFSPTREAIDAFVRGDPAARHRVGSAEAVQRRVPRASGGRRRFEWGASPDAHAADRVDRLPAKGSCPDGAPVVRPVRRGTRRGAAALRRVVPLRSPAVRGRRAGQPRVGGGARRGRRAQRCGCRGDPPRPRGDRGSRPGRRRRSSTPRPRPRDEDVHSFVERELVQRIGEAGRRLHTGRSRNEQVALDLRLYLKRRIPLAQHAIAALVAVLADQAERSGRAIMPSYTHLRRAQPVLVAHFFLSHAAALRRDHARFDAVLEELDELPLGSGAIAGTSYPIDVQRARRRARLLARRREQHRCDRRPRLRRIVSLRRGDGDGAREPARRGSDPVHVGGVRLLRAGGRDGHRQQPDAAEEEPRSAGAVARQGGAGDRPSRRAGWRR